MKYYLDQGGLTTFAQKLTDKLRSIFATKSEIGTPLVAAEAADMTDTTKIYVYTGDETDYASGDWYYYDGSAWQDGGVYNSTAFTSDTTLTIPGAAADAKVTGDRINEMAGALSVTYANPTLFERGFISSSNGANTGSAVQLRTRFRTTGYLSGNVREISVLSGYRYVLHGYNNGTYIGTWTGSSWLIGTSSWLTTPVKISDVGGNLYTYRLVGAFVGDDDVSYSDYSSIVFSSATDTSLSQSGKAADAKAVGDALAPVYDETSSYEVNDIVIYCGGLYVCNTAISTPEAFTPAHWSATTVGDILATLLKAGNVTISATRITLSQPNEVRGSDSNGGQEEEQR